MFRLQLLVSSVLFILFGIVTYSSCIKDQCGDIICYNGGVCVAGKCSCPLLYEGANCNLPWTQKFSGAWNADDTYARDTSRRHLIYNLGISGEADSFFIYGLSDTLDKVICKRSSRLVFTFKGDQKADSFITIKSGKGTMSADERTVTGLYSFSKGDTTITVNFRWTK